MRDKQKRVLQDVLQEKVLAKIVLIQQWIRAKLHRCQFLNIRRSSLMIQVWKMVIKMHLLLWCSSIYCVHHTSIHYCLSIWHCILCILFTYYSNYVSIFNHPSIESQSIHFQTIARGWLARRHFNNLRKRVCSAVIIQTAWRGFVCRRDFLEYREAAIVFQSQWRGLVARRRSVEQHLLSLLIQLKWYINYIIIKTIESNWVYKCIEIIYI